MLTSAFGSRLSALGERRATLVGVVGFAAALALAAGRAQARGPIVRVKELHHASKTTARPWPTPMQIEATP